MPKTSNGRAILAMLFAMAIFTAGDSCMKFARESLPAGASIGLRGIVSTVFALALVFVLGDQKHLRLAAQPRVLVRSGLEVAVTLAYMSAIVLMPLAELTAISQSNPLMMILACALLRLERIGPERWGAVMVGFLGVLLVVKPGPASFEPAALLAVLCAVLIASRDLVNRGIGPQVPISVILVPTSAAVTLGGFAMALFEHWRAPDGVALAALAAAGILVAFGHLGMIAAFRTSEVSVVSPFRYSVILWAALAGWLFFGEMPDGYAALGGALIIASGVYTVHREARRTRALRDLALGGAED